MLLIPVPIHVAGLSKFIIPSKTFGAICRIPTLMSLLQFRVIKRFLGEHPSLGLSLATVCVFLHRMDHHISTMLSRFETEPYEPRGELSSYFADFGKGNFCLTVFDNISVHVYMFTIARLPDKANGALNFQLKRRVFHKYSYSDFSPRGNKSLSLLDCFALPTDDRKKRVIEAGLYLHHFDYEESVEDGDDIPIPFTPKPRRKNEYILEGDSYSEEDYWKYHSEEEDSGSDVEIYGLRERERPVYPCQETQHGVDQQQTKTNRARRRRREEPEHFFF
ncbi:uncharacterized protein LOC141718171 [Apium graveolens]|uniref:uncharacterized protein LOC141718171 n=1 Tax=Apium graveolens TaxID=4045 RepID=UPI003D79451A